MTAPNLEAVGFLWPLVHFLVLIVSLLSARLVLQALRAMLWRRRYERLPGVRRRRRR